MDVSPYENPFFTQHIDVDSIKTVIEAGCDDGSTTVSIVKQYKNASVYALECNPQIINEAEKMLSQYDRVVFIPKAAWSETKAIVFMPVNIEKSLAKLRQNSSCFKWNPELYKPKEKINYSGIIQDSVLVEAVSIDDLCREYSIETVDMFCLDTQGAELEILKGAEKTLRNVRHIITEVNYKPQYDGSCVYEELKSYLENRGFIIKAEPGLNMGAEWDRNKVFENVLFSRG